jgi:predicted nuclease of predicted toxin-antitoxin system
MKILLDVCVSSRSLQSFLVNKGHDVASAVAIDAKASDEVLMARALAEERVFVTEDKDFGELGKRMGTRLVSGVSRIMGYTTP